MLSYDEMPENTADLAKIEVAFPHVPFGDIAEPREIEPALLAYLEREGCKPDDGIKFLRTALVEKTVYWVWSFTTGDEAAYATAAQDAEGTITLSCDTNHYRLTPEQFILADYHNCL